MRTTTPSKRVPRSPLTTASRARTPTPIPTARLLLWILSPTLRRLPRCVPVGSAGCRRPLADGYWCGRSSLVGAPASRYVIVDHSGGLHQRIGRRRTEEPEPPPLQFFGHRRGLGGDGDEVGGRRRPRTVDGRRKRPEQFVQTDVLVGSHSGVVDRRFDLGPIADDGGVGHQSFDVLVTEGRDPIDHESVEGAAEGRTFAQDRQPAEPGLEGLQTQSLVERVVTVEDTAPFVVVVLDVFRRAGAPPAPREPVRPDGQGGTDLDVFGRRRHDPGPPPTGNRSGAGRSGNAPVVSCLANRRRDAPKASCAIGFAINQPARPTTPNGRRRSFAQVTRQPPAGNGSTCMVPTPRSRSPSLSITQR